MNSLGDEKYNKDQGNMSFLGDLKTIVVASGKAVGNSVEALASFTEELERKSKIMKWRSHIKVIEAKMKYPSKEVAPEVKGTKEELLQACNEILALCGPNEEQDIRAKKRALLLEAEQAEVNAVLAEIENLEKKCAVWNFDLPVDEIRVKERLVDCYNRLIELSGKDEGAGIAVKKEQSMQQIALLQTKRRTRLSEHYSSGMKKSEVNLLDGKKDGLSEYWFEGGVLKAKCTFRTGLLHGKCQQWYPDGARYVDADYSAGKLSSGCSVFMQNGVEVIRLNLDGSSGRFSSNLWNGLNFGTVNSSSSILLQKLFMAIRLIFSYSALRSFYRARKGGPDYELYVEYMDLLAIFNKNEGDMFKGFSG